MKSQNDLTVNIIAYVQTLKDLIKIQNNHYLTSFNTFLADIHELSQLRIRFVFQPENLKIFLISP